jgi:hypothetical protein
MAVAAAVECFFNTPIKDFPMKRITANSLSAMVIAMAFVPAYAATDAEHAAHHPAGSASAPATKAGMAKSNMDMQRMDMQIKGMQEMHEKMMAAKTPEERSALMADHMKTMQSGMGMMTEMSPHGMMDMKGMNGMKGDMKSDMSNHHHQMMEKRMDMMQSMMQMMMDRMAMPAMQQKP